jgi:predicted PurR-regulated permease PerM
MMEILTDRALRSSLPLFRALAFFLILISLAIVLKLASPILVPLALAILLAFALSPLVVWLERFGLRRGLTVGIVMLVVIGVLLAVSYLTYSQVYDLAKQMPAYRVTISEKLKLIAGELNTTGPFSRVMDLIGDVGRDTGLANARGSTVVVATEPSGTLSAARSIASPILSIVGTLGVTLLMAAFMLLQKEDLRNRIVRLAGSEDLQKTTAAIDDAASRLGRLLFIQLVINTVFAIVIGTGLWLIGLPSAFLWGLLAGLMRYVPFIGAIAGMAFPLILAFVVSPGWSVFLLTLGFFLVVDFIVAHVIEPMVYGRSTGLSPFSVILAVTVWSFLWGAIGLVIAVPLTLCLVVLGRHVSQLRFLEIILGDRPALPPQDLLYQRLLAGDPGEASRIGRSVLSELPPAGYFDEIFMPSLRRAHLDVVRGQVSGARLEKMISSAKSMLQDLSTKPARRSSSALAASEADTIVQSLEASGWSARRYKTPHAAAPLTAVVLHGDNVFDALASEMISIVLKSRGLTVRNYPLGSSTCDAMERVSNPERTVVFISMMEPTSLVHIRAALLKVKRKSAGAMVRLCIWQSLSADIEHKFSSRLHVESIISSLQQVEDIAVG